MKHISEDELVLYYYGESDDRAACRSHLAECGACAAAYNSLERMLEAAGGITVPERGDGYGAEVWQRLAPALPPRRKRWLGHLMQPRGWVVAAAMACLVLLAFLVGRFTRPRPTAVAGNEQVRERVLLVAVGDHLDRSQMILMELANMPAGGKTDISMEKGIAADLVDSNRLYRQTAARTGDTAVASVLDDLERILLEISHSPSELTPAELERIQKRIDAQGILFKVRVIGSRVRQAESRPAQTRGKL